VKAVRAYLPSGPGQFRVWSYGSAFSPSKRITVDESTLLSEILDLVTASPQLLKAASKFMALDASKPQRVTDILKRCPSLGNWKTLIRQQQRIEPRLYTVAQPPASDTDAVIRIIVSTPQFYFADETTPSAGRCSSYLHNLAIGQAVKGYLLKHPNGMPCKYGYQGNGLAVVTGAAIAGVLAAVKAGELSNQHLWLIWGVRNRRQGAYYEDQLKTWLASGVITQLDIVESDPIDETRPQVVQDCLQQNTAAVQKWLMKPDAWLYISGQESMAEQVLNFFLEKIPGGRQRVASMQWIVSS
jgi:sulfite reductase alpha subunit-like flavoprotein